MGKAMLEEKRRSPRRQVRIAAKIQVGKEAPTRDCTVVDISEYGARIEMKDAKDAPNEFILTLTPRGYPYRRCQVMWRSEHAIGVEFDSPLAARHVHDPEYEPHVPA